MMALQSGHRIYSVNGEEQKKQVENFKGNAVGTIRLQPGGWFYTLPFVDIADKLYNFKFKPTDVLVITYPKCGTTWTQEILWTMLNNPNLDNPQADLPVLARSPFIEMDFLVKGTNNPPLDSNDEMVLGFQKAFPDRNPEDGISLQTAELIGDPRLIKTHLPLSLFHPSLIDTCKIVYVARNPKDVAVSYHHHSELLNVHGFVGTRDSFVDHFVNDTLIYSPYWTHMKEVWEKRDHPNVHFAFYEDMKDDPKREIRRFQDFLGIKLTESQIANVCEYTSFDTMKTRDNLMGDAAKAKSDSPFLNVKVMEKSGGFFRKGVTGDWKNKLSEENIKRIDDWTKKNVQQFGPEFKYYTTSGTEKNNFDSRHLVIKH